MHEVDEKPQSILMFERLFICGLVAGLAVVLHDWIAGLMTLGVSTLSIVFYFGINLPLFFFISRRRSTVAKWIFIVLSGIGVIATVYAVLSGLLSINLKNVLQVAQTALMTGAAIYLMRGDANEWVSGESKTSTSPGMIQLVLGASLAAFLFIFVSHSELFGFSCYHIGSFSPQSTCIKPPVYKSAWLGAVLLITWGAFVRWKPKS